MDQAQQLERKNWLIQQLAADNTRPVRGYWASEAADLEDELIQEDISRVVISLVSQASLLVQANRLREAVHCCVKLAALRPDKSLADWEKEVGLD